MTLQISIKLLKSVIEKEEPQLVIVGKQAIDDDSNQVGQMLAALLGWSQGTFACGVEVNGSENLTVRREIDGGIQTLDLKMPAVITTDLRLNEPRYVKLPDIMKAKKKPMEIIDPSTLNVDLEPSISVLKVSAPPPRQSGVILNDASELVAALKEKDLLND